MAQFIAYSTDDLSSQPIVHVGDVFLCAKCGNFHELESAEDQHGNKDGSIMFYKCGDKTYLAAVDGHSVMGEIKPVINQKGEK